MIMEFKIKKENQFKDFNGLTCISIQAYKELNPFGVEFIEFYELRDYKGNKSHHFIKSLKIKRSEIKREFDKIERGFKKC